MSSGVDGHTKAEHEALKADFAWDTLKWRKEWVFEDHVLEQRNCSCGTTLARKSTRVIFVKHYEPMTIGTVLHVIRFHKGVAYGARLRGARIFAKEHDRIVRVLERTLLELCEKGP